MSTYRLWLYEQDSGGHWEKKSEGHAPVVPRVGDTISNSPLREVVGVDYLLADEPTLSPIISLFLKPVEGHLGDNFK